MFFFKYAKKNQNLMEDATGDFYDLITCISMQYSLYDAALYCERALKTDSRLLQTFYRERFGSFSKHTFLAKHISENLLYALFYPVPNPDFVVKLMYRHQRDRSLLFLLAEMYQAHQVWEAYFLDFKSRDFITKNSVRELQNIMPSSFLKKCKKNTLHDQHFFLPQQPEMGIHLRVSSVFLQVQPQNIVIDKVAEDGNCFFSSIQNQFSHATSDPSKVSIEFQRESIQDYIENHFRIFVSVVQTWREIYETSPDSQEWHFFAPYAHEANASVMARKMIQDRIVTKKQFWADTFAVDVVVEYISRLFGRRLMIVFLNLETESSFSVGMGDLGMEQWVTFLIRDNAKFYSFEIEGKRFFPRLQVPLTNLPFLKNS